MTRQEEITHVPHGAGEQINMLGEGLRVLLSSSVTQPPFSLMEVSSPPGSGPPALHTHPPMEAFYILEGTYEFTTQRPDGPVSILVNPGDVVYVPGGIPHNYKNVGESTARMLAIFTDPMPEQFFREAAAATTDESGKLVMPPDMAKLGAIMAKHQLAFVGGPPGPRP